MLCFVMLPMYGAFQSAIDMRLHEKPVGIHTYDWCVQQADSLVMQKIQALLPFIGLYNKQQLHMYQRFVDCSVDIPVFNFPLPDKIAVAAYNLFHNEVVAQKVGFIRMERSAVDVTVITEKCGMIKIAMLGANVCPPPVPLMYPDPACAHRLCNKMYSLKEDLHVIELYEKEANVQAASTQELEILLGHELAHIFCNRDFNFLNVISTLWANKNMVSPVYDQAYNAYFRSLEIQADIVGLFGNPAWVQASLQYHTEWEQKKLAELNKTANVQYTQPCFCYKCLVTNPSDSHPSETDRRCYLDEIAQHFPA